jgi:hypothetical protein
MGWKAEDLGFDSRQEKEKFHQCPDRVVGPSSLLPVSVGILVPESKAAGT